MIRIIHVDQGTQRIALLGLRSFYLLGLEHALLRVLKDFGLAGNLNNVSVLGSDIKRLVRITLNKG